MDEIKYRESRVCRLLGTPVVYQRVLFLESGKIRATSLL